MEPEKSNSLSYEGFQKFVQKGAKPAKTVADVLEILKHRIKSQQVLDDYGLSEDIVEDDNSQPLLTQNS